MLVASEGGGYGGTDWTSMTVEQMWKAIESQDTTAHYQTLTGWQQSADLLADHQSQVTNYRNNLAAAWPPEKSPASAAYLARLDKLVASLQETYDAAVANHRAFADATLSISLSRQKIKQIYDEYTANQTKLDEFHNQPPHGGLQKTAPPKPPVADGRQDQLNNEARGIMFSLSSDVILAGSQLRQPTPYVPAPIREDGGRDNGGITHVPPTLPKSGTYDPTPGSSQKTSTTVPHSTAHNVNAQADPPTSSFQDGRQPGLVLGGLQPTPTVPSTPAPGIPTPAQTGGVPLPTTILPTPPMSLPPGGSPRLYIGEGISRPGMGGVSEPVTHAMPPGGIIGATPGVGLGQPERGARPVARANPVGGVIQPSSTQRSGGSASRGSLSGQALGNVGGRNSGRRSDSGETLRWDPDNPWATEKGVSPVVLPTEEQPVDPGPAIGLD